MQSPITKIRDFSDRTFIIEPYQRGYKWTDQQIKDLLEDLKTFIVEGTTESVYCLQPIVVLSKGENRYELLDGQQRITTLFIILSYLKNCAFSIEYNTRKSSRLFLNELIATNHFKLDEENWKDFITKYPRIKDEQEYYSDNVDNFHFFHAYKFIHKWFSDTTNRKIKENPDYFLDRLGVIEYTPFTDDVQTAEKIFRNINSNKIALTNAELIKGKLIINGVKEKDELHKLQKQQDIAREWDYIENQLQNNQLWYYLNPPAHSYRNRITFLFEKCLAIYFAKDVADSKDKYALFHALDEENLLDVWEKTTKIFRIIVDWFDDANPEMYHFVGYALAANTGNLNELMLDWNNNPKDIFLLNLKKKILKAVGSEENIKKAAYDQNGSLVTKILLLHNILTLRKKIGEHYKGDVIWSAKFRFDLYTSQNWSLEHIHAQNEPPRDSFDKLKPWIRSTIHSLEVTSKWDDTLKNEFGYLSEIKVDDTLESWAQRTQQPLNLNKLLDNANQFAAKIDNKDDVKHNISNLALLSGEINSQIGNGYFNEKRKAIINCDKQGSYILPTTKNVFLKFYSENTNNLYDWDENDREAYLKDMTTKIEDFRKEVEV